MCLHLTSQRSSKGCSTTCYVLFRTPRSHSRALQEAIRLPRFGRSTLVSILLREPLRFHAAWVVIITDPACAPSSVYAALEDPTPFLPNTKRFSSVVHVAVVRGEFWNTFLYVRKRTYSSVHFRRPAPWTKLVEEHPLGNDWQSHGNARIRLLLRNTADPTRGTNGRRIRVALIAERRPYSDGLEFCSFVFSASNAFHTTLSKSEHPPIVAACPT